MKDNKPILTVDNLCCGYQDNEILHNISFNVEANEKVCIIGPNGCGKTTLLRGINQIIPIKGKVVASGMDISKASQINIARKISLMSQISSIYFSYTVLETVQMGRYPHKKGLFSMKNSDDQNIIETSMRKTGIWDIKDRLITELSGGQLQRVLLARTFTQTPDIILLDEPTNHLDLKYQLELMKYLDEWVKEENRCVVSVLHDINLALNFADKILLINEGKVVSFDSVDNFSLKELDAVYGLNVREFMCSSYKRWNDK